MSLFCAFNDNEVTAVAFDKKLFCFKYKGWSHNMNNINFSLNLRTKVRAGMKLKTLADILACLLDLSLVE
jgi:hypothetical protein